jgi:hypothetical protein
MTSESASQSISAGRTDDIPPSWDERTILTTFLDYARDTVHAKCAGLSDADARRALLPGSPLMTISGLVSHLRWVESAWIEQTLLGGTIDAPWTDDDPDREFRIGTTATSTSSENSPTARAEDDVRAWPAKYASVVSRRTRFVIRRMAGRGRPQSGR